MKFGEILTRIRTDKKLSQKEVAEITGLQRTAISMFESGARYPKRQNYNKIIRGLGISEKDLPYVEHTKRN